ncbi:hypothetical protein COCNU_07G014520 [Cocos nucifera]|uniref:Uncharacterized protein n=1 Tax=Cocos nucifera TaxID=13894 RepID=A0A8K0N531_COCNU|nr:hypothetical protein COCNU_07G014520 [Cocos nucifera]
MTRAAARSLALAAHLAGAPPPQGVVRWGTICARAGSIAAATLARVEGRCRAPELVGRLAHVGLVARARHVPRLERTVGSFSLIMELCTSYYS